MAHYKLIVYLFAKIKQCLNSNQKFANLYNFYVIILGLDG